MRSPVCGLVFLLVIFCSCSALAADFMYKGKRIYYERNPQSINAGFRDEGDNCAEVNKVQPQSNSALTVVPDNYKYTVIGSGCGQDVYGVIDIDGVTGVVGYLYLENGNEVPFHGEWVGVGVAEGVDNKGNLYTIKVED